VRYRLLTHSTFGSGDNKDMLLNSFVVIINPGHATDLSKEVAKSQFESMIDEFFSPDD
jgi:hypothetical protein